MQLIKQARVFLPFMVQEDFFQEHLQELSYYLLYIKKEQ